MPDLTAILPLDGTALSEEALELVPFLRQMGVNRLRLVSVWETLEDLDKPGASLEKARSLITAYLESKAARIGGSSDGFAVETSFRAGRAADQIIAEEVDSRADLIVLATHGRTGIERWRLGSVADEVVRRAAVPVLMAGPNMTCNLTLYRGLRIMVPLDGLPLSEQALPAARAIAARTGASVSLVRVVTVDNSWSVSFEVEPAQLLADIAASAEEKISKLASDLGATGEVLRAGYSANIPEQLMRYANAHQIDLIVMTSHSRASLERWLLGSVADAMLRGPAPVLLVKPGEVHASRLLRP